MQLPPDILKEIRDGMISRKSLVIVLEGYVSEMKDDVLEGKLLPDSGKSAVAKIRELLGKLTEPDKVKQDVNKFV